MASAQNAVPGLQPYNQNDPQNYGSPAAQSYNSQQAATIQQLHAEAQPGGRQQGGTQPPPASQLQSAFSNATPYGFPPPLPQNQIPGGARNESLNAPRPAPRASAQSFAQAQGNSDNSAAPPFDPAGPQSQAQFNDQPPPPLPELDQPESPGDGYLWTPGYWAAGPDGYYWVGGVWVEPPYTGALWTPGFWGYDGGGSNYFWNSGYWGSNVGFYGGLDYGYGYFGNGFYGGAWNGATYFNNGAYVHLGPRNQNLYNHRYPGVGGAHPGGRSFAQFDPGRSNGSIGGLPTPRGSGLNAYGGAGAGYGGYTGGGLGHLAQPGEHTVGNGQYGGCYGGACSGGGYGGNSYGGGYSYHGGYNNRAPSAPVSRPSQVGPSGGNRGGGNAGTPHGNPGQGGAAPRAGGAHR